MSNLKASKLTRMDEPIMYALALILLMVSKFAFSNWIDAPSLTTSVSVVCSLLIFGFCIATIYLKKWGLFGFIGVLLFWYLFSVIVDGILVVAALSYLMVLITPVLLCVVYFFRKHTTATRTQG